MADKKVIVIGLDGGTWNIIKPLVKQGKLPTIESLMNSGCHGNLESTIPPVTFPAWKCYSTGKNPGKLGVFHFINLDINKKKVFTNTSESFKSKEIWDYLSDSGFKCGILDMPTTYPPKRVNGFMVSHPLYYKNPNYTYPGSLEAELENELDYRLNLENPFNVNKDLAIEDAKKIIIQRFETASYLYKRYNPDFFHLTIFHIDPIQHYFWGYMESKNPTYGKIIEDTWMLIDKKLKKFLDDVMDENTYVILMSDHGFRSLEGEFNFSRWLINNMYLKFTKKINRLSILARFGFTLDNVFFILSKLKIINLIRALIPYSMQKKLLRVIPSKKQKVNILDNLNSLVDWNESKVICIYEGLYINTDCLKQKGIDYSMFREELINKIREIKNPDGKTVFNRIYKKEDMYTGAYTDIAPDLEIVHDGYLPVINLQDEEWNFNLTGWTAIHRLHGIFTICGPDIKKGMQLDASIYDLAPTILHLFGMPIPKDMDGRVLKEIFKEDSEHAKREIEYQEIDEKEMLKEKINVLKKLKKI